MPMTTCSALLKRRHGLELENKPFSSQLQQQQSLLQLASVSGKASIGHSNITP